MAYIEKWICRAEQTAKHCSDTTFVKAGNQKQKECSGNIQQHVYCYVSNKTTRAQLSCSDSVLHCTLFDMFMVYIG